MAKNVNFKITADSKNAESGLKKVTSEVNKLTKQMKRTHVANFATSFNGLVSATRIATNAIKKTIATINELNDAYIKQAKAEKSLETACKNNPYLNKTNAKQLEEFASELQNISNIGDEQLLPLMAELAAAGRTQTEIQDIMNAAVDISASGVMSLESAVSSLSKSYSGTVGQLTKASPDIKNLTDEELRQGKAVEVLAKQYKGMAKELSQLDGKTALKNATGDVKEEIGAMFNEAISPVQRFFATITGGWAAALKKKREYKNEKIEEEQLEDASKKGNLDYESAKRLYELRVKDNNEAKAAWEKKKEDIALMKKAIEENEKALKTATGYEKQSIQTNLGYQRAFVTEAESKVKELAVEYNKANKAMQAAYTKYSEQRTKKSVADTEARKAEEAKANKELVKSATEGYYKKIEEAEKALSEKKKIYNYSELEEAEEMYNAMQVAALQALTELNGYEDASSKSWLAKVQAELQAKETAIKNLQKKEDKKDSKNSALMTSEDEKEAEELVKKWTTTTKTELQELQEDLAKLNDLLPEDESAEGFDKIKEAIDNCSKAIDDMKFDQATENFQAFADCLVSNLSTLSGYVSSACSAALTAEENQTEKATSDLEAQYAEGLLSYEEYQDKLNDLDKESAKEQYKIKMFEWSMNLAVATAQAAQAVINALSSGEPPVNILNSVTAGLLGAAQIATIAGSKPVAPTFATGGFLTGNSYSGDKIAFMGNAGEAILNPAEQRAFMDMANGNYKGGLALSMPIHIENNASDLVQVSAFEQEQQITMTISKVVNNQMQRGVYNQSLNVAENSMTGARYL